MIRGTIMMKSSSRFNAVPAVLAVALLLSACSGQQGGPGEFSFPPMPVEVVTVQRQTVVERFEAVGTIEALEAVVVVSEIDAALTDLAFSEGSTLSRGDLIAQLDDSQLSAEVARAEALSAQSRSSYERIRSVVEQKAGSAQDLDDAVAALRVAEANLALAKARFAKTRIVAPFNGVVGARRVSVGTFLRAGQAVTEMANIDAMRVNFSTPERYLSRLSTGAEVAVSTTAFPGVEWKGKILVINPIVDIGTRTTQVVARVTNPGRKLRSGMSANVSAVLSSRPNAITVPNEAVFATGAESFVFVVNPDSSSVRIPVTLGIRLAGVVEVVRGLEPNMKVVRAGHQKLFEGAKVMPMESQGGQPSK